MQQNLWDYALQNHDFQKIFNVNSSNNMHQIQLLPALAMLQIQTLNMNCDKNLFSFKNKTSVCMTRDFMGRQNCPLAKPLECHFKPPDKGEKIGWVEMSKSISKNILYNLSSREGC